MSGDDGEKIKLLFLAFDDDGNGVLSYKEFLNAVKKFSQHLNKEEAETLVKKVRHYFHSSLLIFTHRSSSLLIFLLLHSFLTPFFSILIFVMQFLNALKNFLNI